MENNLNTSIVEAMKVAMKSKDQAALGALRALKTGLQNASIAKGNVHAELDTAEEQAVIRKQIKQREDSIAMYEQAGRQELAEKEQAEIKVLASFLPEEMKEEEVIAMIDAVVEALGATSKKDMGRVMKEMQARSEGRAPGKLLSQLVSKRLA